MAVDLERLGLPFVIDYIDDRFSDFEIADSEMDAFIGRCISRIYRGSPRIKEMEDKYGPLIGEDEWNLINFALLFYAQATRDTDPARLELTLELREEYAGFKFDEMRPVRVSSGSAARDIELSPPPLKAEEFFRNVTPCIEAGLAIPDEALTDPKVAWATGKSTSPEDWLLKRVMEPNISLSLVLEKN